MADRLRSLRPLAERWQLGRIVERLQGALLAAIWARGASMAVPSVPIGRRPAQEKNGRAEEPAGHALGRSRGGFGTKLRRVTDGRGTPLAVALTPEQSHEAGAFEGALHAVPLRGRHGWPQWLAGDKGYKASKIRACG